MMKIYNFQGELTDISSKKEALAWSHAQLPCSLQMWTEHLMNV